MASRYAYQAKSVRVELRQRPSGKWIFRLVDWFGYEIDRVDGFKTKMEARVAGSRRKLEYQKTVKITPIKLSLVSPVSRIHLDLREPPNA